LGSCAGLVLCWGRLAERNLGIREQAGGLTNQPQVQRQLSVQHVFSGPIPPPTELAQYESIHTGLADRIVAMAEKQMMHRQELERLVITGEGKRAELGQIFALVVAICGLVVAALCAFWKNEVAASIIGALDITGLAGVFIYGSKIKREELAKRKNTPAPPPQPITPV